MEYLIRVGTEYGLPRENVEEAKEALRTLLTYRDKLLEAIENKRRVFG